MRVNDIKFLPAAPDLRATGLRGWATVTVDDTWVFASIGVRRAASGEFVLAFPTRRDGSGHEYSYYRPTGPEVRNAIEDAVLGELRKRGFIS